MDNECCKSDGLKSLAQLRHAERRRNCTGLSGFHVSKDIFKKKIISQHLILKLIMPVLYVVLKLNRIASDGKFICVLIRRAKNIAGRHDDKITTCR